jgi:hypothetical protein
LLALPLEISMGVPGCLTAVLAIVGWGGTVASERTTLVVEKSADAIVPAGSMVAGKG